MPPSRDPAPSSDGSARELLALLGRADIAVVRLTPSGEIVAASAALAELTGRSRETLRGTPISELLTAVPPSLDALFEDGAGQQSPMTVSVSIPNSDGELIACELYLQAVSSTDDRGRTFVGTVRRWAESLSFPPGDAARDAESVSAKAFIALADSLADGIIVLDTASKIQYANPAVERILGHTAEELVGGSKLSIIPERLRDAHLAALNRYLETGEKHIDWEYVELPGQHKQGHEVPLGISLNDFFFEGNRYFVGLFRDISARKAVEEELRERERQLNRYKEYTDDVLNAVDDIFFVLDADSKLQRWNRSLREVTGYTDAEISSMHAREFFAEDDRGNVSDATEVGFETGTTRVEASLATSVGERIPYEFSAARLEDPDGDPVLAGIGRDVTDRTRMQRRLEASNERLEQFAYAASHDLQEPLRMVSSYLKLIESRYGDSFDEDGEEFLEFALDGAERMRGMIDGLLEYSRVDTRGDAFESIDLNAVLEDVQDDLQLKIEESSADIDVETLPEVSGDGGQLRQVFQNLLSNAIEYSGDEPPEIRVSASRDGDMWRVAVEDRGIGIEPTETDRIFQVFQRLQSHTEASSGTGLGLALCERIVDRHGGRIWVETEPGDGSTFFLTLPDANATPELETGH